MWQEPSRFFSEFWVNKPSRPTLLELSEFVSCSSFCSQQSAWAGSSISYPLLTLSAWPNSFLNLLFPYPTNVVPKENAVLPGHDTWSGHSLKGPEDKQYPSQEAFGFFGSFSSIRSVLQYNSIDRYTSSCFSRVQRAGAEAGRLERRTGVLWLSSR